MPDDPATRNIRTSSIQKTFLRFHSTKVRIDTMSNTQTLTSNGVKGKLLLLLTKLLVVNLLEHLTRFLFSPLELVMDASIMSFSIFIGENCCCFSSISTSAISPSRRSSPKRYQGIPPFHSCTISLYVVRCPFHLKSTSPSRFFKIISRARVVQLS